METAPVFELAKGSQRLSMEDAGLPEVGRFLILYQRDFSGGDQVFNERRRENDCVLRGPKNKRFAGGNQVQARFSFDKHPVHTDEACTVFLLKLMGRRSKPLANSGTKQDGYPIRVAINDKTVYDGPVPLASGVGTRTSGNDVFFVPEQTLVQGENFITIRSLDDESDPDRYYVVSTTCSPFGSGNIPFGLPGSGDRAPMVAVLYESEYRDFHVEYAPRIARKGQKFSIGLRVLRPHREVRVRHDPAIRPVQDFSRSLDSAGLHHFEFTAEKPLAGTEVEFLSEGKTAGAVIGHITSLSGSDAERSPFVGLAFTIPFTGDQLARDLRLMHQAEFCDFVYFWDRYVLQGWMRSATKEDWISCMEFCKDRGWYVFLKDPRFKISPDTVAAMKDILGDRFLGSEINEPSGWFAADRRGAGKHYWFGGYTDKIDRRWRMELQKRLTDLKACRDFYVNALARMVDREKEQGYERVIVIESSPTINNSCDAGAVPAPEIYPRNANWLMAQARGCARAHATAWYYHIAIMCQTSIPHDGPDKYRLWDMTLFAGYMYGGHGIWNENGVWRTEHWWGDPVGDMTAIYRGGLKKIYDFARTHERLGSVRANLAVIHGYLDGDPGAPVGGEGAVYGQLDRVYDYGEDWWLNGPAEAGWQHLATFFPVPEIMLCQKKAPVPRYLAGTPYGQIDIIPSDTPQQALNRYSHALLLGWNTMTPEMYQSLVEYVKQGGMLFMALPQLSTCADRGKPYSFVNKGDLAELFGVTVLQKGDRTVSAAVCDTAGPLGLRPNREFRLKGWKSGMEEDVLVIRGNDFHGGMNRADFVSSPIKSRGYYPAEAYGIDVPLEHGWNWLGTMHRVCNEMSADFSVAEVPSGASSVTITCMDCRETSPASPISIEVLMNEHPAPCDTGALRPDELARLELEIEPGMLKQGVNRITVRNLEVTPDPEDGKVLGKGIPKHRFAVKEVRLAIVGAEFIPSEDKYVHTANVKVHDAELLAKADNGSPLLIQKKLGKGRAYLLNTWEYPGHPALVEFMQHLTQAIAESSRGNIYLSGEDMYYICYAVYDLKDGPQKTVYILNTDNLQAGNVKQCNLHAPGFDEIALEVVEGKMAVVTVFENLVLIPENNSIHVGEIQRTAGACRVPIHGSGKQRLALYSLKPTEIRVACNGKDVTLCSKSDRAVEFDVDFGTLTENILSISETQRPHVAAGCGSN